MSRNSSQAPTLPQLNIGNSSLSYNRKPSIDTSRITRSTISRDASPQSHSRLPSLQLGQPYIASPGPSTSRTITQQSFFGDDVISRVRGRTGGPEDLGLGDLLPPPPIGDSFSQLAQSPTGSRASSLSRGRPDSRATGSGTDSRANSSSRPVTPTTAKLKKSKTWLPGRGHNRTDSGNVRNDPWAYIAGAPGKTPYSLDDLGSARLVPELWFPDGDLEVHLFGEEQAASFRIHRSDIDASRSFRRLLRNITDIDNLSISRDSTTGSISMTSTMTESGTAHLYIPLKFANVHDLQPSDYENLIAIRNLFAFLVGQILIATPGQPDIFSIFKNVAGLLLHYEFTNTDGSTFGIVSTQNFLGYVEDLGLDDVRPSRQKTLEAVAMGEMMKSWPLFNEGYTHAVGKWNDIFSLGSERMKYITPQTRQNMERSHTALEKQLAGVRARLDNFDFPSLFAGVAASGDFSKDIDVKSWRNYWVIMRRFTMNYYKNIYGDWPPRASSKKNNFHDSGLNRIVLQHLWQDFTDLYNMLVDKTDLTTRTTDTTANQNLHAEKQRNRLRQLMSEFDRSSPPVKPPIPYDLPLLPNLKLVRRDYDSLPEKKQAKERSKKLKDDDVRIILMQSYDRDFIRGTSNFIKTYMEWDRDNCNGKSVDEMVDFRLGQWIFLYVVLQSLPLVVVDAKDLRYSQGVEYFLCEGPKGTPPWLAGDIQDRNRMYRIGDGKSTVALPMDAVHNSTEAIYERSHCWVMAKTWSGGQAEMPIQAVLDRSAYPPRSISVSTAADGSFYNNLVSPPVLSGAWRPGSAGASPRNSVALGLEEMGMPPPLRTDGGFHGRKVSTSDVNKTFDDFLPPQPTGHAKKKSKGFGSFSG